MNFHAQQRKIEAESLPIRSSVGIMLLNEQGKVFGGRRKPKWVADHSAKIWQMPKAGVEKLEPLRASAQREFRFSAKFCTGQGDLSAALLGVI